MDSGLRSFSRGKEAQFKVEMNKAAKNVNNHVLSHKMLDS